MDVDLSAIDPIWFTVAAGVLLLAIVGVVALLIRRRRRRKQLEERYGAEYQRTVEAAGSRRAADRELHDREERRQGFELRRLDQDERDRFTARWEDLQASFVDGPAAAVLRADELIDDVAAKVGYPKAGREQRLADLSVDHPATVDEYRRGRPSSGDAERGPSTEQLRQALLTSRSLFEAVLGRDTADVGLPPAPFRELEDAEGRERSSGTPEVDDVRADGTDGRATSEGTEPREIDLRGHEHVTSGTSPVLGPDGRPLPHDR